MLELYLSSMSQQFPSENMILSNFMYVIRVVCLSLNSNEPMVNDTVLYLPLVTKYKLFISPSVDLKPYAGISFEKILFHTSYIS
jgi:hypothetical protein